MSGTDSPLQPSPTVTRIVDNEIRRRRQLLWIYVGLLLVPLLAGIGFSIFGRSDRELIQKEISSELVPIRAAIERIEKAVDPNAAPAPGTQTSQSNNASPVPPATTQTSGSSGSARTTVDDSVGAAPTLEGLRRQVASQQQEQNRLREQIQSLQQEVQTLSQRLQQSPRPDKSSHNASASAPHESIPVEIVDFEVTHRLNAGETGDFKCQLRADPKLIPDDVCVRIVPKGPIMIVGSPLQHVTFDASGRSTLHGKMTALPGFTSGTVKVKVEALLESCGDGR